MYLKYTLLFSLFIGFFLAGVHSTQVTDGNADSTPAKVESNKQDELTTISKPLTSTAKPKSTSIPSTVSTTIITTSTTTVPSSSVSPSTIPSTTIPTTSQPTLPPTSPSTTPAPVPPEFWTVTDSTSNITCIVARMNIELEMHQENQTVTLKGNPQISEAKGKCGKGEQQLEIFMPQKYNNSAIVKFNFTETEKSYFISALSIKILLNSSDPVSEAKNVTLYETGKNTSYSCPSYILNLEPKNKTTVKLSMGNIQVEAFRRTNTTKFSQAVQCPNSEVPDIVPLIVGLALAGLVIVVVIGYFIGRKRTQAQGYLSM